MKTQALILTLLPLNLNAQVQVVNEPGRLFQYIEILSLSLNDAFVNGINTSGLSIWIDSAFISFATFFLIRSILEFNNGTISVNDLVFSKIFFIFFVFTIVDPLFYMATVDMVEKTSNEIGHKLQIVLTGFHNFYELPGGIIFYFLNINPTVPDFSWLDMVFTTIILIIAGALLYKNVLNALIAVCFFYFFSFVGFKLLAFVGIVILPFIFIKELSYIVKGFIKAVSFMFLFNILWKLIMAISGFLIMAAIFGANFLVFIRDGRSMHDFYLEMQNAFLGGASAITVVVNSPLDVLLPLVFLAIAIFMMGMSFPLTQFVLTGFLSVKTSFIGNQQ